jgi:DNA primase
MIPAETVAKIIDTSRIEEVVGDFVSLKRRGVNLLGLCPFHAERTPSFTVSPAKGIYKCFGCGKAGDSVRFIMDHEQLAYPEALRYLARKYQIEVEETPISPEQQARNDDRESILQVLAFAQKTFSDQLWEDEVGMAIGEAYFQERGFIESVQKKFQLGYAHTDRQAFLNKAREAGFQDEFLLRSGMVSEREGRFFDRFAGRVMFPIHNVAGRVIGFGGRILTSDKQVAKYLNSPETEVYHKSQVLYGFYYAKRAIMAADACYLVEGYTDVISLHQCGIENVVASSGTSLTVEQIRLIRRFTRNITILYDGDAAGIKASFRGINLVLEEGMNVNVLLFPDGEDPDSFSRSRKAEEVLEFLKNNSTDFITFKTKLLLSETAGDPVKKAGLIRDLVESIALIPDAITRSVYLQQCSRTLEVEEQVLVLETNKQLRTNREQRTAAQPAEAITDSGPGFTTTEAPTSTHAAPDLPAISETEHQERDLIRILLLHGTKEVELDVTDPDGRTTRASYPVSTLIYTELNMDNIRFENALYAEMFSMLENEVMEGRAADAQFFRTQTNPDMQQLVATLLADQYELSKHWEERHNIVVITEHQQLKDGIYGAIYALKTKVVLRLKKELMEKLKTAETEEEIFFIGRQIMDLDQAKGHFASRQGRVILK